MNTVENGLRSYRNNDTIRKEQTAQHALDILSDTEFGQTLETRPRDSGTRTARAVETKERRHEFRDLLKREIAR